MPRDLTSGSDQKLFPVCARSITALSPFALTEIVVPPEPVKPFTFQRYPHHRPMEQEKRELLSG